MRKLQIKYPGFAMISLVVLIEIFLASSSIASEVDISDLYFPNYNIGDSLDVVFTPDMYHTTSTSPTQIGIGYSQGNSKYGTLIWRYPKDNGGEMNGRNLSGAKKLTFWGRTREGNMAIKFVVGPFTQDTDYIEMRSNLDTNWRYYEINLAGRNLTNIRGGFACTLDKPGFIYLDDIRYIL